MLVVGCGDGTIRFIDIQLNIEIHCIQAHQASVNALCFHPTENKLISGGKDALLKVWELDNYEEVTSVPAHNYAIYSIVLSPDQSLFATASRDRTIKIWETDSQRFLVRIDAEKYAGHSHSVNKILWMDSLLLSAGDDRKVIGWKIDRSK